MNYNRRPNRPDGNLYREMRRRGLRPSSSSRGGSRRGGRGGLVALVVAIVGVLGWMLWR